MDQTNDAVYDALRAASHVCSRLEVWAGKSVSEPMTILAQEAIRKLGAAFRAYENELVCVSRPIVPNLDTKGQDTLPSSVSGSARHAHSSIQIALGTLTHCHNLESLGDEGALNALFLSRGGRTQNSEDASRDRLGKEVADLLGPWLGPHATQNRSWGLDTSQPCIPPNMDKEINDVPYVVDVSTDACAGSFGVVRKVHQRTTRKPYAEKTYRNLFSGKERKAVLKELGVLEICRHPNIVTLVDAYEVTDEPHVMNIVMSPWAPFTLQEFLYTSSANRKKHVPWFEPNQPTSDIGVYNIMMRLTEALAYLHGLSIKHKDIKPDNILLHTAGDEVTPYITDVGVSKVYWRGAKTNYDQSTYSFLSLEQLEHKESSLKADIWQLGCCFAMLLALVRGGQDGVMKLHVSYQRTDENCSCNIAKESEWFMRTLDELCSSGSAEQKHMHWITRHMLDLDPSSRFDIGKVMEELGKLVEITDLEEMHLH
ncbi:serine/threonine protein kinase [Colletotrichum simmondsii]|uniref:Serine/threonine protein kinase n=1 Tax=Colletotrichum simmondsii TaxID=703756 RepID=A0A135TRE2_9PEZI|nr:serine/threonine protein kinase [Colletotrichum simmondsii]